MRRFWSAGPRRLRWKLLRPLGGTFALLWLGTMALLTHNTGPFHLSFTVLCSIGH